MTEVAVHWEYKELDIPLEIANVQGEKQFDRANNRATAIILKYLQDASRDGWQADELTDFFSLLQRSRVKARRHQWREFFTLGSSVNSYDSVTIRLKRLVQ